MNPFETHGIGHLSASSINLYAAEPAMWVLQYLYGHRSPSGAAAARGIAAEHGIAHGLFDPSAPVEDCIALALQDYDKRTALASDSNREKERDGIPGMVEVALAELRQYGVPEKPEGDNQHRIEVSIDGIEVPVIGFLDFRFPEHGIIVDLKTQLRLASQITASHARQGAVYSRAHSDNIDMRFAYTTPKKVGVYSLEDTRARWDEVVNIAHRIRKFLSLSTDKADLAAIIAPNYDNFYWNTNLARAAGRELYGY
jgi:hypothetical protein